MYFLDERFLGFVPIWVAIYWLAGQRLRNWVLLVGSFAWLSLFSRATLLGLLGLTVCLVYPTAWLADRSRALGDQQRARRIAWSGVVALIAVASALRLKSYILPRVGIAGPEVGELLQWIGFSYFLLKAIHVMLAVAR